MIEEGLGWVSGLSGGAYRVMWVSIERVLNNDKFFRHMTILHRLYDNV